MHALESQLNDLLYAKNHGSGDAWLPGKITAIHGSMLFTVQLKDGRIVWKHTDQLRSRIASNQDTKSGDDGNDLDFPVSRDAEVQETTTNADSDVNSQNPPTEDVEAETSSSTSTPDEPQTENEHNTEQSEQESTPSPPMPRRSGRISHPPNRFEPTKFY